MPEQLQEDARVLDTGDDSTSILCPTCGYILFRMLAGRCSECGTPFRRPDIIAMSLIEAPRRAWLARRVAVFGSLAILGSAVTIICALSRRDEGLSVALLYWCAYATGVRLFRMADFSLRWPVAFVVMFLLMPVASGFAAVVLVSLSWLITLITPIPLCCGFLLMMALCRTNVTLPHLTISESARAELNHMEHRAAAIILAASLGSAIGWRIA